MASLALVVSLIFLISLASGPLGYLLCRFTWMPPVFKWLVGILNILIGIWWLLLPISIIKYIGLSNLCFGILILKNKR
jgi:hypothetical protein